MVLGLDRMLQCDWKSYCYNDAGPYIYSLSLFVYKGVSMDYRDINFNLKVDLFVYKRLEGCIDK